MGKFTKFTKGAKATASSLGSTANALKGRVTSAAVSNANAAAFNLAAGVKSASRAAAAGTLMTSVAAKEAMQKSEKMLGSGYDLAGEKASTLAARFGDQNSDGKFDQDDLASSSFPPPLNSPLSCLTTSGLLEHPTISSSCSRVLGAVSTAWIARSQRGLSVPLNFTGFAIKSVA